MSKLNFKMSPALKGQCREVYAFLGRLKLENHEKSLKLMSAKKTFY
jgi:hypothetical protein